MRNSRFAGLMRELRVRSGGAHESGAFLLAPAEDRDHPAAIEIVDFAFYDDLDPESLPAGIELHPIGFSRLNDICASRRLRVVADIHCHPFSIVRQSAVDAANPMSAFAGHVAFIAPDYAEGVHSTRQLGAHLLGPGLTWTSNYVDQVDAILRTRGTLHLAWIRITDRLRPRRER